MNSVVKVGFMNDGREFPYYNNKFDLKVGDIVYVDGKQEGKAGIVLSVISHFKVSKDYYKMVIAKLDLDIKGKYFNIGPFMSSYSKEAVSPEQFASWIFPPKEKEEEFYMSDGYTVTLEPIFEGIEIDDGVKTRGIDLFYDDCVKYICLDGNKGQAFIKGSKWYKLDFLYEEGVIKNLLCECKYPGFCKHEVALCITIKNFAEEMMEKRKEKLGEQKIVAINNEIFYNILYHEGAEVVI
ncbi:MAG: hypothetical protein RR313_00970 [Anaerovoracaceae bacterium]